MQMELQTIRRLTLNIQLEYSDNFQTNYSPEGPANDVPCLTGEPKLGLPSEFQLTFCAIVYRLPSQAPALLAVA